MPDPCATLQLHCGPLHFYDAQCLERLLTTVISNSLAGDHPNAAPKDTEPFLEGYNISQWAEYARHKSRIASRVCQENGRLKALLESDKKCRDVVLEEDPWARQMSQSESQDDIQDHVPSLQLHLQKIHARGDDLHDDSENSWTEPLIGAGFSIAEKPILAIVSREVQGTDYESSKLGETNTDVIVGHIVQDSFPRNVNAANYLAVHAELEEGESMRAGNSCKHNVAEVKSAVSFNDVGSVLPQSGEVWCFNGAVSSVEVFSDAACTIRCNSLGCRDGAPRHALRSIQIHEVDAQAGVTRIEGCGHLHHVKGWIALRSNDGSFIMNRRDDSGSSVPQEAEQAYSIDERVSRAAGSTQTDRIIDRPVAKRQE